MAEQLKNIDKKVLSNAWATLYQIDYDYKFKDGKYKRLSREAYDRGNGAAILLYNVKKNTVILSKQFRMPAYQNTKAEGYLIEVCAGAIDENESPETCIIRETEEEVGYRINQVKCVMKSYMSPGAVTEKMYLFVAAYTDTMKLNEGGGLEVEGEEIEVLELAFDTALQMINSGKIMDAKTIMLLQYAQIHNLLVWKN